MTGEMNSHEIDRRAAGDNGTSNHSNSTQPSSSQSQGANTSSSQNSTTTSQSKSTSQSQSTSKQPSQSYTQTPSPSPTNATSPSNSNGQSQNNQTQAPEQGQGQGQSTPNASSQAPINSTSPQPSVNNAAPSNTSTPDASKSAPANNSSVAGTQSKPPTNSSPTAAPLSTLNSSVPFSTTTASNGFGITGSSSQGDHQLSSSISPATIAGIAVGGVAGLILIVLLALFCYRKRKSHKATMELQDSEKQKGLKRFSKDSHMFNRLGGNTYSAFDSPSRRNSAPRLDIRMHQHHVSMESEEDRAASAGLSGLERRSSSLIDFFDQVHIHREPMMTNGEKSSESEHMEFFFINEGAPELSNLVRKGSSSSSVAHSLTTSNSLREMIQKNGRDIHNGNASSEQQPMPVQHEEPFDAATNRNSAIHLMEPSKETNPPKYSRNSILSNLSSSS